MTYSILFHRVIPALMFTILFYFTTYKVFTGGPFSSSEIGDAENCRLNWWTNLLMLNNLVNTEKSVSVLIKSILRHEGY